MRKKLGAKAKRLGAVFLSVTMLMTSVSTSGLTAYADEDEKTEKVQEITVQKTEEEQEESKEDKKESEEETEEQETSESDSEETSEELSETEGESTEDVEEDAEEETETVQETEEEAETETEEIRLLNEEDTLLEADDKEDEDAEGLIARYVFGGESGSLSDGDKIKDVSGSKNSYNAVVRGKGTKIEDHAVTFNGEGYIELDADMFKNQDTFTTSIWVKNEGGSGNQAVMFYGTESLVTNWGDPDPLYYWLLNPCDKEGGKLKSVITNGRATGGPWGTEVGISANGGNSKTTSDEWALYTTVVKADSITAYMNGEKVASADRNYSTRNWLEDAGYEEFIDYDMKAYIGMSSYTNDRKFRGSVRDVQIFDTAISSADVKELYEQGLEDMSSGLVAEWDFSKMSGEVTDGTVVEDISGSDTAYDAVIRGKDAETVRGCLSLPGGAYSSGAAYVELDGDLFEGQDNLTISAWLSDSTGGGDYAAMYFGTDDSTAKANWGDKMPAYYWLLNPHAKSQGYFKSVMSNGTDITVDPYNYETGMSSVVTDADSWGLYTTVITEDKIFGYYNGKLVKEDSHPKCKVSDWGEELQAFIGKSAYHDKFYKGLVGNVQVYTKALDEDQIADIYNDAKDDYVDVQGDVAEGLLAQYDFSGLNGTLTSGTAIKDMSGNGNKAVIKGTGASAKDGILTLPGGEATSSAAYVELPQGMFDGQNILTINSWIEPVSMQKPQAALYFGTEASVTASWGLKMPKYYWLLNPSEQDHGGYFKSVMTKIKEYSDYPYQHETARSTTCIPDSKWGMYTTVITEDEIIGYYNGEEVSRDTHEATVSDYGTGLLGYIGKCVYSDNPYFQGSFKDVQIYNEALDEAAIKELYQESKDEFDEAEGELIVHYTFDDMKGTLSDGDIIKDETGKGNDAKVVGKGAKVMRGALALPGGAWNSGNAYVEMPKGLFDGQDVLTISVMVQNNMRNGNKSAMYFGNNYTDDNGMPTHYWLLNPMAPNKCFKSVMTNGTNTGAPYNTETATSDKSTTTGWGLYTTVITKTQIKGYYNGKLVSTESHSMSVSDFGTELVAYLGKSAYKTDELFNGQLKDVRVYDKALTEQEIMDIYEENFDYEYPTVDVKATSVSVDGIEDGGEIIVNAGDKLTTKAQITLNDGTTVEGYVNWDKDITELAEGIYTVNGTVDYFPSPLVEQRADPYLTFDEETGLYFFCGSWPAYKNVNNGYDRIALRTAETIDGIHEAEDHEIWHAHESGEEMYHIWAPEIHKINGEWYVYYAASEDGVWAIRPYVLKYTGKTRKEAGSNEAFLKSFLDKKNWTELGQFKLSDGSNLETFSLDMTYFEVKGQGYLVWADKYNGVSSLYIGKVDKEAPYQLTSEAVMITTPEYDWERVNEFVNEGPAVMEHNGKLYLAFSASATGVEYCVGLLEADKNADLLDIENWKKYPVPVLTGADVKGQYGPGHNSFSVDADGNAVMVYHARDEKCNKNQCDWANADPLYDPCRNAMVKYIRYTKDGQPVFSSSAQNELGDLQNISISVNIGNLDEQGLLLAELKQLEVHNLDDVRGNLYLPAESPVNGYPVIWESSNKKIITNDGIVTRQKTDKTVTLTATITKVVDGETVYLEDGKTPLTATLDFEASVVKTPGKIETSAYMFAYFTGEGYSNGEQIYFASSRDGLTWNELNDGNPVLTSSLGEKGVRDPYIMRTPEGDKFYLIATDLKINGGNGWGAAQDRGSRSLMIWESTDLVNWSDQRMVEVATEGAGCTWAPEAFYNEKTGDYMVFWASRIPSSQNVANNDATHRIYYATTRDFYTFSEPEVWIELHDTSGNPISIIDTTVIKVGDTYYRFSKNEDGKRVHREGMPEAKYIILEKSKDLLGEWTEVTDTNLQDYTWLEGATCFKFNGKEEWCLLLDDYGNGGYIPFTTSDIGGGQFYKLTKGKDYTYNTSREIRHGSVLPLTASEYKRIMQKWNGSYEDEFTLLTELPDCIEAGSLDSLPRRVQIEDMEGATYTTDVEWKTTSGNLQKAGSMVTVEGRLVDYGDRTDLIRADVLTVSKNMKYLVDCGITNASGKTSTAYQTAKEYGSLLNQEADAAYDETAGWGYVYVTGTKGYTANYGEMLQTAHYGENDGSKNVTYRLTLDKGIYDLTAGSTEYWGQNRTTDVVVSYEKADGSFYEETVATMAVNGVNGARIEDYGVFEVTEDATVVKITFKKGGTGDAGLVAYFAVTGIDSQNGDDTPDISNPSDDNNTPDEHQSKSKKKKSSKKATVNKNGTVVIQDDATALSNVPVRMLSDVEKTCVAEQIAVRGVHVPDSDCIYTQLPDGAVIFRDGSALTADNIMILVPTTIVLGDGRVIAADGTWIATLAEGMVVLTMDKVFHTVCITAELPQEEATLIGENTFGAPVVTLTEADVTQIASTQIYSEQAIIKENASGITSSLQVLTTARSNRTGIVVAIIMMLIAVTSMFIICKRREQQKKK